MVPDKLTMSVHDAGIPRITHITIHRLYSHLHQWGNVPLTGVHEVLTTHTRHSQADYTAMKRWGQLVLRQSWEYSGGDWQYGKAVLADALGDRIVEVQVRDPGIYDNITALGSITIDFNSSHVRDHDRNGTSDFVAASISGRSTHQLNYIKLEGNASYEENSSGVYISRGLFNETPTARILYDALGADPQNRVRGIGPITTMGIFFLIIYA